MKTTQTFQAKYIHSIFECPLCGHTVEILQWIRQTSIQKKWERGQKKKNARMEVASLNVELMIWWHKQKLGRSEIINLSFVWGKVLQANARGNLKT